MQGTQSIEKFSKKPTQHVEGSEYQQQVQATKQRRKKLNKPQRGGGVKGEFRNAKESAYRDTQLEAGY